MTFKSGDAPWNKGKPWSDETKKKMSEARMGSGNGRWKGGRTIRTDGYVSLRDNNHPNNYGGEVLEHRIIIEREIGRYLHTWEIVHHVNGIKNDNRIENLCLCDSKSAHHGKYHNKKEGEKYVKKD